jgi:hypothetical protein
VPEQDYSAFLQRVVAELPNEGLLIDAVEQALVFSPPVKPVLDRVAGAIIGGDDGAERERYLRVVAALWDTPFPQRVLPYLERLWSETRDAQVRRVVFEVLPKLRARGAYEFARKALAQSDDPEPLAESFVSGFVALPDHAKSDSMVKAFSHFHVLEKAYIASTIQTMLAHIRPAKRDKKGIVGQCKILYGEPPPACVSCMLGK